MKSFSLALSAALLISLSACNEASASGKTDGSKGTKLDSLAAEVKTMHEEFEILKYGLEKRGLSIGQMKAEMEADNKVWDIPVGTSPVFGNTKDPLLTIVEFSEFQCPYCARIAPTIHDLMNKHKDEIKFVFKHFPLSFHKDAPGAAAATMAAQEQGKFWEYRYALADKNRELNPETFKKVAKEIGLDMAKFEKSMALDSAKQARINEDFQLGVKVGVQGTPNFYINGKRQDRFSPDLVEKLLKEAKEQKK